MPTGNKNIILVDSNALAHRAFHAYPDTLTTRDGKPTNAIYGFFSMFVQILSTFKPEAIICVFDTPEETFRDKIYDKYKANRPEMDKSLAVQIPQIIKSLRASNIQTLTYPGLEADDVIGSLVKSKHFIDYHKIIVTGDRDLFQVLGDDTKVYLAGNPFSNSKIYDTVAASEKMGFDISKIILFKALKGDPSDNIPGVPGVGDVTAIKLLAKYSSLKEIYDNLKDIKPTLATLLKEGKDKAEMSLKLATIKTDAKINVDLDNFEVSRIDFANLKKEFERLEFRSLVGKISKIIPEEIKNPPEIKEENLKFDQTEVGENNFEKMLSLLEHVDSVALYCEEDKNIFKLPQFLGVAIKDKTFAVKIDEIDQNQWNKFVKTLKSRKVIVYNGKYLIHVFDLIGLGSEFNYDDDVLLARFISSMGQERAGGDLFDQTKIQGQQSLFAENVVYSRVYSVLNGLPELYGKMLKLYRDIEMPISRVLARIERAGIRLNSEIINNVSEELDEYILNIQKDIYKDAGEEFNISSPKQLGHILFDKLGIKGGKKNKSGGFSTNEKFLLDHIDASIIPNILLYRELTKLKSTYTSALLDEINPKTGRIHTTFNQAVAVTGRLSSTDPNLQNIPTNSDWGLKIRRGFEPEKGKMFVSFDYSQQELRLLAEFSGDKNLTEAFKQGLDIHTFTASKLFGIPMDKINVNERRSAKTVNFGVVYGISAFGLADRLKIPTRDAQKFINGFYASYPEVMLYFKNIIEQGKQLGYVESLFGRRKNTVLLNSSNFQIRSAAERETINFPLQGSAADLMKKAMLDADRIVRDKYLDFAIMILQVHDEIIFEVNTTDINDEQLLGFASDIKKVMDKGFELGVPMQVDVKCGSNWAELKKINIIS